jgi:hypothetical protein
LAEEAATTGLGNGCEHEIGRACGKETPNSLMDFLRAAKNRFYDLTHLELWGYEIDTPLHLAVAFGLVFLFARVFSLRLSVLTTIGLILLKEVVDYFATPRRYFTQHFQRDPLIDLAAGVEGVLVALMIIKWWKRWGPHSAAGD